MLTNDLEVAVSGELIDYVPVPDPPIQIYLARAELSNAGIVERSIGLMNTIGSNKLCTAADAPTTTGGTAPADSQCVFPFTWDGVTYDACTTVDNGGSRLGWCKIAGDVLWGNCKCDGAEVEIKNDPGDLDTTHRIVALGTGAYAQLVDAGIDPAFQCGDDQVRPPPPPAPTRRLRTMALPAHQDLGKVQYFGQTVYTQGLQAAAQIYAALLSTTGEIPGLTGSTSGADNTDDSWLRHPYFEASHPAGFDGVCARTSKPQAPPARRRRVRSV